jgi:hypothetical protein
MADINVNVQYDYTIGMLGSFSGESAPAGSVAPHPISVNSAGNNVIDLSAITLGGVNGLNN